MSLALLFQLNLAAGESDVTAPTLSTATIPLAGTTIVLTFSEAVSIGAGGNGGFTVSLSGGAATLTYSSGSGTSQLTYTISRTVAANETGTVSYTQPGNGVEDAAGNDLATFSNMTISRSGVVSIIRSVCRDVCRSISRNVS